VTTCNANFWKKKLRDNILIRRITFNVAHI
jgi:hypothetical protein